MNKFYLDAGTTWSKIIEQKYQEKSMLDDLQKYLVKFDIDCNYYILPSAFLSNFKICFEKYTGHMGTIQKNNETPYENEIVALAKGASNLKDIVEKDYVLLDLGSRDVKWIKFKDKKFIDLDWNNSCASATGATLEMLLKFYNVNSEDLIFSKEKYNITCGIFGLEKIMDDIAKSVEPKEAISKFVHGIAFNAWNFTKRPQKLYISGGFCDCECFVNSLSNYCEVVKLGRFVLAKGLLVE